MKEKPSQLPGKGKTMFSRKPSFFRSILGYWNIPLKSGGSRPHVTKAPEDVAIGIWTGDGGILKGMSVQSSSKLAIQCFPATSGRKLGWISMASSFFQLIGVNHLWCFTSSPPLGPLPMRLLWSFCRS